jgi:hypothetical protein
MLKLKSSIIVGIIALLAVNAQPKNAHESALTTLDYAEIEQLNAHYAHAIDSCADNGKEWANLFTSDGVFMYFTGKAEGREALTALAGSHHFCDLPRTPLTVRHININVMIEPSPGGAIGKSYVLFLKVGKDGRPGDIEEAGKYYDVYVTTSVGWRFKSRRYVRGLDLSLIPESELLHHPLPH